MIITSNKGTKFEYSGKNVEFSFYNILMCRKSKSFYNMVVEDEWTRFRSLVRIPKEEVERFCQEIDENAAKTSEKVTYIFERKFWGKYISHEFIEDFHVSKRNSFIISNEDGKLGIIDNESGDETVIDGEFEAIRKINESVFVFTNNSIYRVVEKDYGVFETKIFQ